MKWSVFALLIAFLAAAQEPFQRWLDEDATYLLTERERAMYGELTSEEARREFVEQFWLRRDPSPGTASNEVKEEHYRRIAYANQRFAAGVPGWKSDRGRVYIILGPPDQVESYPNRVEPFERWLYRKRNVSLTFTDPGLNGSYALAPVRRVPDEADRELAVLLHLPLERIARP